MRRFFALVVVLISAFSFVAGCEQKQAPKPAAASKEAQEAQEKMLKGQTNAPKPSGPAQPTR